MWGSDPLLAFYFFVFAYVMQYALNYNLIFYDIMIYRAIEF